MTRVGSQRHRKKNVLFVCKCVLPPGDKPIAVNKYINIISKKEEASGFSETSVSV